jgi:hypothetical protein
VKNRGLGKGALDGVLPVAITGVFVAMVLLLLSHSAGAQEVDVRISELGCEGDPEVVVIINEGDQPVEMTGWNLQSDPTTEESLELDVLGTLDPQESVLIQSGPSADAAFIWSRDFIFRDRDPTDFAQLASDAGDVRVKVNCGTGAQPTTTATPAQTPAPVSTPTPLPAPADAVPVGGGPPGGAAGLISPAAMIVVGGWLLTAGLGAFAVPLMQRSRRSDLPSWEPATAPAAAREVVADQPKSLGRLPTKTRAAPVGHRASIYPAARATSIRAEDPLPQYLALTVILLVLVAVLVFRLLGGKAERE